MDDITIYGRSECPHCDQAKSYYDRQGIAYRYVDLDKNPQARARLEKDGYQQIPVVKTLDDSWQGSRPDKLIASAMAHRSREQQQVQATMTGPARGPEPRPQR